MARRKTTTRCLYRSADAVIAYLDRVDPEYTAVARDRYAALDHVRDPQRYGYEAASGLRPHCRDGAVHLLLDLMQKLPDYLARDGRAAADAQFYAERNARIVVSAETYYRAMFGARINTWNLRDKRAAVGFIDARQKGKAILHLE